MAAGASVGGASGGEPVAGVDSTLCSQLGRVLDAAMAVGDYAYVESAREWIIDLIGDTELRLRARAAVEVAMQRGDLARVRALTAALVEGEGGWLAWREKALALLDPPPPEAVD